MQYTWRLAHTLWRVAVGVLYIHPEYYYCGFNPREFIFVWSRRFNHKTFRPDNAERNETKAKRKGTTRASQVAMQYNRATCSSLGLGICNVLFSLVGERIWGNLEKTRRCVRERVYKSPTTHPRRNGKGLSCYPECGSRDAVGQPLTDTETRNCK